MVRDAAHPPWPVLLAGAAGMVLGLWFDVRAGGVATLASLCQGEPPDLVGTLVLHWDLLPWMHLGMVAGGMAAIPALRRHGHGLPALLAASLSCLAWMTLGMAGATLSFASLAGWSAGPAGTVSGMLLGMAWGMAASVAFGRLAGRPTLAGNR